MSRLGFIAVKRDKKEAADEALAAVGKIVVDSHCACAQSYEKRSENSSSKGSCMVSGYLVVERFCRALYLGTIASALGLEVLGALLTYIVWGVIYENEKDYLCAQHFA